MNHDCVINESSTGGIAVCIKHPPRRDFNEFCNDTSRTCINMQVRHNSKKLMALRYDVKITVNIVCNKDEQFTHLYLTCQKERCQHYAMLMTKCIKNNNWSDPIFLFFQLSGNILK